MLANKLPHPQILFATSKIWPFLPAQAVSLLSIHFAITLDLATIMSPKRRTRHSFLISMSLSSSHTSSHGSFLKSPQCVFALFLLNSPHWIHDLIHRRHSIVKIIVKLNDYMIEWISVFLSVEKILTFEC